MNISGGIFFPIIMGKSRGKFRNSTLFLKKIYPYTEILGKTWQWLTAWKVSKYEVISGPYFPVFSPNTGKYGPEKTGHFSGIVTGQSPKSIQKGLSSVHNWFLLVLQCICESKSWTFFYFIFLCFFYFYLLLKDGI